MRASLFVNLVAMRAAMSKRINPPVHLADENLDKLQKAVYLFHSAHSCSLIPNSSQCSSVLFQTKCIVTALHCFQSIVDAEG